MLFNDVQDVQCDGLQSTPVSNGEPMLQLESVTGAWLSGSKAPKGSRALLRTQASKDILVSGCDLRGCAVVAEGDADEVHSEFNMIGR